MDWTKTLDRVLYESLRKWLLDEGFRRRYYSTTEHALRVDRKFFDGFGKKRSDSSYVDVAWITGDAGFFSYSQRVDFLVEIEFSNSAKQEMMNCLILKKLSSYYGFSCMQVKIDVPKVSQKRFDDFFGAFCDGDCNKEGISQIYTGAHHLFDNPMIKHRVLFKHFAKGFREVRLPNWSFLQWFEYLAGKNHDKVMRRNIHPALFRRYLKFIDGQHATPNSMSESLPRVDSNPSLVCSPHKVDVSSQRAVKHG